MPKIRKLKRRKKFRANVNRKRLRNKLNKLPNIECKEIKEEWESKRSTVKNLTDMGLAYNPNLVLQIPKVKSQLLKPVSSENDCSIKDLENSEKTFRKAHVAKSLEEEAKCPRVRLFRLPNNEVQFVTYMMDKYGDDYMAMVRDYKNYNQLTWRQIKAKIERFKSVPEQFAEYLVQKGEIVLEDATPLKKIKPIVASQPVKEVKNSKASRRKRKKSKLIESIWQEESIVEDEEPIIINENNDTMNKLTTNVIDGKIQETLKSDKNVNKKLVLFPDDENESISNDQNKDIQEIFNESENASKEEKFSISNKKSLSLSKNKRFKKR